MENLIDIVITVSMNSFIKRGLLLLIPACLLLTGQAYGELIAHYDFSDGDLLDNEVGASYTLTEQTSGTGTAAVVIGAEGTAVFPGGNTGNGDTIAWLDTIGPGALNDFTVSFWFRTDTVDQDQSWASVFSSGTASSQADSWQLHSDGNNSGELIFRIGKGNDATKKWTALVPHDSNTWYHVVIRKDSDGADKSQVYVTSSTNSALGTPVFTSANTEMALNHLLLGVNRARNQSYGMELANVRIFDDSNISLSALFDEGITPGPLPDPLTIENFSTADHYLEAPGDVTLNWAVSNAVAMSIDPIGDVLPVTTNGTGQTSVIVSNTTTFTLSATNGTQTARESLTVHLGPPRPNFVIILVDDMGPHDTSALLMLDDTGTPTNYNFNSFYKTPNVEHLAADGMRFTTAYAQSVCSPTRNGIMTGRNSARHGVTDWIGANDPGSPVNWRIDGMEATDMTLPKQLQSNGYHTIHIGKAHFAKDALDVRDVGFDVNVAGGRWGSPPNGYINYNLPGLETYRGSDFLTKALTIEAYKKLDDAVATGQPFFLNMCFYAVHSPFTLNPDATNRYDAAVSTNHYKFATMIEGMDIAVGEIRQKLVDLGVAEDTLIIFIGDNGSDSPATNPSDLPDSPFDDWPMRGKKGSKWEGGTRVPFIACWAAANATNPFQQAIPLPANSIETDIVTTWDIPATLLDIAGITPAADFGEDAHSLKSYFAAIPGTHRPQELVIHYPHTHRSDFFSWIRQGDMKLIYNFQDGSHQLFNLTADPTESNDLAASRSNTVMRMARALAQKLEATWGPAGELLPTIATTAPSNNVISIPDDSSIDLDGDGIADSEEDANRNGLVDSGETDPDDADTDDDGTDDNTEQRLGLNPLDSDEFFWMQLNTLLTRDLSLTWPSAPGVSFTIRTNQNLGIPISAWPVMTNGIPAEGGSSTRFNFTPSDTRAFYAVELE